MQELDYAWRFEAGTEYVCPIEDDPFQFMMENNKTTSFSMSLYEYPETIPTLYDTVLDFAKENRLLVQQKTDPDSLWHFIWEQGTEEFNRCHLWNNFQVYIYKKKGWLPWLPYSY
jgi:alpha 1,2-mannosyltransferase